MQGWTVDALLAGMRAWDYLLVVVSGVSWLVTAGLLLKLRTVCRELQVAKARGDLRRWIRSGEVRHVAADALEKHGLLALMTPGMANELYRSLEASLGTELGIGSEYAEWERWCGEGPWNTQVAGRGKRNREEVK
jgi:hypothetical protein